LNAIIPRLTGGIGNQLFIYAAARRMAIANSMNLVIDDTSGFKYDVLYKRFYQLEKFNITSRMATPTERLEPFSKIRRYLKRKINKTYPFAQRAYITQEKSGFDPRLLVFRPKGNVYLDGYWQSENYFKDIEGIIRQDLIIKSPSDSLNIATAERIKNTLAIAVHVRFFDMVDISDSSNCQSNYYHTAIAKMEEKIPNAHYFIFSDKPVLARLAMPLPDDRITIIDHNIGDMNAYADLWLMSLCKHFVIANSTFSWWGAWLSDNKEKIVIAPDIKITSGVTQWGFDGLIPDEWIKL